MPSCWPPPLFPVPHVCHCSVSNKLECSSVALRWLSDLGRRILHPGAAAAHAGIAPCGCSLNRNSFFTARWTYSSCCLPTAKDEAGMPVDGATQSPVCHCVACPQRTGKIKVALYCDCPTSAARFWTLEQRLSMPGTLRLQLES